MGVSKHDPIKASGIKSAVIASVVVTTGLRRVAEGSAFAQVASVDATDVNKIPLCTVKENYPAPGQLTIACFKLDAGSYVPATEAADVRWAATGE